ncbi:hypothetical protein [Halorarius litoreus]|uniref:hypothetical protein n=1 Tax=Halorarius litoreus TaxID=2962676 RepID=UPI0020CECD9A|nr:hypothetical protein [Halorarius litoreus]
MHRRRYLALASASAVSLAGCVSRPSSDEQSSTVTPSPGADGVSVAYVVRPGSIPDDVAQLSVDFAVYLAERSEDVYACTTGAPLMDNKYDPTPTPLPEPEGACERFDAPRVDVATLDGSRTLGPFEAGERFTGGHTLVAHDVTLVLDDGTTATDVYDTDFRAVTERTTPSGTYGVEIGVTDYANEDESPRWRYGIDVQRFEATPVD